MSFTKLTTEQLNRLDINDFRESIKLPLVVVLDNLRSQHNTGSIFRTADAFRIEAIHLCGITAIPPAREIHKTALGATESVQWKYFETTMESVLQLKNEGYIIVGIEQTDKSSMIGDFKAETDKKYAIILGNEVHGISEEVLVLCDLCIEIPQYGTKHSLNVSVSAAIMIWEFFRQSGYLLDG